MLDCVSHPAPFAAPRGRSRGRAHITGRPERRRPSCGTQRGTVLGTVRRLSEGGVRKLLCPQVGFEPTTLRLTAAPTLSNHNRPKAMKIRRSCDLRRRSSQSSTSVNDGRHRCFPRVASQLASQIDRSSRVDSGMTAGSNRGPVAAGTCRSGAGRCEATASTYPRSWRSTARHDVSRASSDHDGHRQDRTRQRLRVRSVLRILRSWRLASDPARADPPCGATFSQPVPATACRRRAAAVLRAPIFRESRTDQSLSSSRNRDKSIASAIVL
jgi:hypothetical protein